MSEKRFTYDTGNLFDNKMNTFYQIEDSDENIELFCDNLNSLVEENEQLKKKIEKLHDLIFRLRTENAFDRAIEKQSTITVKEFLDELDKW